MSQILTQKLNEGTGKAITTDSKENPKNKHI